MKTQETLLESLKCFMIHAVRPINYELDVLYGGFGSALLVSYKNKVFAVTAKHVLDNHGGNYHPYTRISMPNTRVVLPIKGMVIPQLDNHHNSGDVDDFVILDIDEKLFTKKSGQVIRPWDFEHNSMPAREVNMGSVICVIGFPETDDRYDYDNNKINDTMLVRNGIMGKSSLGSGMYEMKGSASEFNFNGLSGSPIFYRTDNGDIYYIGLVTRGTASSGSLHFIDSYFISKELAKMVTGK
jgi:hypothetical protein